MLWIYEDNHKFVDTPVLLTLSVDEVTTVGKKIRVECHSRERNGIESCVILFGGQNWSTNVSEIFIFARWKEKEKFFRLNEKKIGEERTNGEETIKYYAFRRIRSVWILLKAEAHNAETWTTISRIPSLARTRVKYTSNKSARYPRTGNGRLTGIRYRENSGVVLRASRYPGN